MTGDVIVAEIGMNWNPSDWKKSWAYAIDEAADAGATHVKGQDWYPISEMNRTQEWKDNCDAWTLGPHMKDWIHNRAAQTGLGFFTSVFTETAVDWAEERDHPFIKVATSESTNYSLLRYLSGIRVPTVISYDPDIPSARLLLSLGILNGRGEAVPCVAVPSYPAAMEHIPSALVALGILKAFGLPVGWSSHFCAVDAMGAALAAKSAGASYFEFHFRSSICDDNPDGGAWALSPMEFAEIAEALRGCD